MSALARLASAALLSCAGFPALSQASDEDDRMRGAFEALAKAPKPNAQADLDTFKLASAHRERAESVQERTNGLWQSWLLSICEGCGPPMLSYKQRGLALTRDLRQADARPKTNPAAGMRPARPGRFASISSDLSPENVSQIRRMPR